MLLELYNSFNEFLQYTYGFKILERRINALKQSKDLKFVEKLTISYHSFPSPI